MAARGGRRARGEEDTPTARREMALAIAALFAAGGVLAVLSLVLPHPRGLNELGVAVPATAALVAAPVLATWGQRAPRWGFELAITVGVALISVGIAFGGLPASQLYAPLYVWTTIYAFYFFPPRAAWATLGAVMVGYALVLMTSGSGSGQVAWWLLVSGTAAVAGIVVGVLAHRIRIVARSDELTGLANRRAWEEVLPRELARAARTGSPVTVAIIDLDHFKRRNDSQGHQGGDRFLKEIVAEWSEELRAGDLLARYGGDEFAVLLPSCRVHEAEEALERLRRRMPTGESFSAGVAAWDGVESPSALLTRADAALYDAKSAGRDRVVAALARSGD